ncbi:carboxymuconolactone decarboxylase family protein [Nannocystaceae bacterium ST9]
MTMTSFDELERAIPDWAKDLRLNLGFVQQSAVLTPRQLWGTALACALACKHAELVAVVAARASEHLEPLEREAAASAAAIMAMNNVYYRFTHLVSDTRYQSMPARLRMQILGKPGVAKLDYELWCMAVSAINGCGACMDSHAKAVIAGGGTAEQVQEVVRVGAILAGVAQALSASAMLRSSQA